MRQRAPGALDPSARTSAALPQAPRPRRRTDVRILVAVVLIVSGMVGTVTLIRQAGERTPVLVAARTVAAGQVIGAADVTALELGLTPGVATLGVAERDLVVGRVAAAPLARGQILSPGLVADQVPLAAGEVAITISSASPAGGLLRPGHVVQVVATPSQGSGAAVVAAEAARVLAVAPPEPRVGSQGSVTLAIPQTQAPAVAAASARDAITLVLLPAAEESAP